MPPENDGEDWFIYDTLPTPSIVLLLIMLKPTVYGDAGRAGPKLDFNPNNPVLRGAKINVLCV